MVPPTQHRTGDRKKKEVHVERRFERAAAAAVGVHRRARVADEAVHGPYRHPRDELDTTRRRRAAGQVPDRRQPRTGFEDRGGHVSFGTPSGTRGGWQPRTGGPVGRWLTKRAINQIRRKGKVPGLGFNALVLTTIGRKSGLERTTPVGWVPGKDGSWLIVASAAA